jgi:hypothetical protein
MMLEFLLCFSPADRAVADAVAARLERSAEVIVTLADHETETVAAKLECGLSSATAVLLVLSPDSVPATVSRDGEWGPVLEHIASGEVPAVGSLLVRDCKFPRILERGKHFFRWTDSGRDAMREIEKWALSLSPQQSSFRAARLPWFEGRDQELNQLWQTLVDQAGRTVILLDREADSVSGKTSLAQEFCRRASAQFRDVIWVDCAGRPPVAVVAALAEQLGRSASDFGTPIEAMTSLIGIAARHRVLLVLDDFPLDHLPLPVGRGEPENRGSLLVTARSSEWVADEHAVVIPLDLKPSTSGELLIPENPSDFRLWKATAVCRRGGFPLELAVRIAEIDPPEVQASCARLIQMRLLDPLDDAQGLLRLSRMSQCVAMAAGGGEGDWLEAERQRHAQAVYEAIAPSPEGTDRERLQYAAELLPALQWAIQADWRLAVDLARRGFRFFRDRGRVAEGAELLFPLRFAAEDRGEEAIVEECEWDLSWIRTTPSGTAFGASAGGGEQLAFEFA